MKLTIPRGIVYHRLRDDIKWLFQSIFFRLDDYSVVTKFEREFAFYLERKHCVAFPFARTAIYFALKLKDLPDGSEIIMPPITIKSILDVVLELGLKPVFVDINPDTLCFDEKELKDAVGEDTKAIIITYLFGMVPDIVEMLSFCHANNLFVIEDFSQCLNGKFNGKKMGSFGNIGVYSASSIKTLDTYGGGLLVCDDDGFNEKLKNVQNNLLPSARTLLIKKIITDLVRNFATNKFIFHFLVFPLIRVMSRLKPNSMMKHTGERNKEMIKSLPDDWFRAYTSFQAMVGLELIDKVKGSDQERVNNVKRIKASTDTIYFPLGVEGGQNVYWQLVAYFDRTQEMQEYLHSHKVDTSTTSLEKISSLSAYPYQGETPNADKLYTNGLFIPSYKGLSESDVEHVCNVLNSIKSI